MNFGMVAVAALITVIVVHAATYLIGRGIGQYNVVDIAWGVGFVGVTAVGLRLAWHMDVKTKGKGEDPRYRDLLQGDLSAGTVIRRVFLTPRHAPRIPLLLVGAGLNGLTEVAVFDL